ncbi:MAG: hypothetical protein ACRDLN_14240 [Solirubrobacteraceae bacterium]
MAEQRLRVESGPPQQMISDAEAGSPPSQDEPGTAAQAKDKAQEAAAQAKDKAQQAAAPVKEKAREVAGEAKAHAQAAAGQAKDRAAAQVGERSTQVGQQIGSQAEALGGVAEELRRKGKDGPAKIADQAAERVEGVASYLEQADGDALVAAAKDAVHDHPAAAAAIGAAAGFAAGRVIKAAMGDGASPDDEQPAGPQDRGA